MILATLFLLGCYFLGQILTARIALSWYRAELYAVRFIAGVAITLWLHVLLSWLVSYQVGFLGVGAVHLLSFLGVLGTRYRQRGQSYEYFAHPRQQLLWAVTTGLCSLIILFLLYQLMLLGGSEGVYSAGSTRGDFPLHLALITHFAEQPVFSWDLPLLSGAKATYPFFVDYFSSVFLHFGLTLRGSLLFVSVPLLLALVQLLFFAALRLLDGVRAAALTVVLFVFSGSNLGFLQVVTETWRTSGDLFSAIFHPAIDYSIYKAFGFGNLLTTVLIPQRSFQLGLPIFCVVLLLCSRMRGLREVPIALWLLLGSLIGLLPLIHAHTFFVCCFMVGGYAIISWRNQQSLRPWVGVLATALVIAAPQLIFQLKGNEIASFIRFDPGWLYGQVHLPLVYMPVLLPLFLFANFGIGLLFTFSALKSRRISQELRMLAAIGLIIFIGSCMFIFQPARYDNVKFLLYSTGLFNMVAASVLAYWSRIAVRRKLAMAGLLTLTLTGFFALIWQVQQRELLYSKSDLVLAEDLKKVVPVDALVLTSQHHDHPLWGLTGRSVVLGYHYWLWSYGFDIDQRVEDIKTMYSGSEESAQLLQKYGVTHVYISDLERSEFTVNELFFREHYPAVFSGDGVVLYKVR